MKVSQVTEGTEGVAGVRCVEEDHRRLQRPVPAAGADDQQGDEAASLGPPGRDHRTRVPRRTGRIPTAPGGPGASAPVQGGRGGRVHFGAQGEGHRS